MTKSMLSRLVLVGMAVLALQRADAASAVAWDGGSNVITSTGQRSVEIAKYDALSTGRKKFGANVRVIASTPRSGYGAIAVARKANGHGQVIGIALGRGSQSEADRLAMGQCLKDGGAWPAEVRWRIRG
jgi:Domain of unknown function (DUF4189)